ncbi:MAG: LysM peptidoglycan-binding domain-containing M23 family metallopeptidase [Bacillota bacterium]|jgi:murein DD-endopeptidase MepM/ murein hydrolase activator NlpD
MKKFLLLTIVSLLVLTIPVNAAAQEYDGRIPYTVKANQSISNIAQKYGVDTELLAVMNNMDPKAIPTKGTNIWIPQEPQQKISVKAGDTLWELAKKYNTSISTIVRQNNIANPSYLKIGQQLLLPADTSFEYQTITRTITTANRSNTESRVQNMTFTWPLQGSITSVFGSRKRGFHHGLDIAAEAGTEIESAKSGTIIEAGWISGIYGRGVMIDHGNGYSTLYAHAQDILVSIGDDVRQGQAIATVGMTGRTTGPHLHFEIRINDTAVNPYNYLR